ncbi:hypothetical protein CIRMBP1209_01528 [Enterococcus cecorum]|nr:hypothetical protein CIRMBP1209_01528 [Enterococcus cecorum]
MIDVYLGNDNIFSLIQAALFTFCFFANDRRTYKGIPLKENETYFQVNKKVYRIFWVIMVVNFLLKIIFCGWKECYTIIFGILTLDIVFILFLRMILEKIVKTIRFLKKRLIKIFKKNRNDSRKNKRNNKS